MIPQHVFDVAYEQARQAFMADEVPVGAVVFHPETFEIIACAHNLTRTQQDPTAHAEILVIQKACRTLNVKRLDGYALFVTLEPCVMCAGALSWAHLDTVYYGASDSKTGAIEQGAKVFNQTQTHHKPIVYKGIEQTKCAELLTTFFQSKRQKMRLK